MDVIVERPGALDSRILDASMESEMGAEVAVAIAVPLPGWLSSTAVDEGEAVVSGSLASPVGAALVVSSGCCSATVEVG